MSVKLMTAVWESAPFDGATLLTLIALADSSGDEGWSWPSLKTIAEKARQPERTTYQSIKNLIEAGWLEKHPDKEKKRVYFRVVIPATIAESSATIAKIPATIAKPPHPLIGGTVIEPSLNRKGDKRSTSSIEKTYIPPSWINLESWEGYIELRRHKRAVMTDRALNGVIARLEQFRARGHDPNEILDTSLRSNWTDVYEPKATGGFNGSIPNGKANANLGVLSRVLAQTERTDSSNQNGNSALSVGRRNEPRALLENS